MDRTATSLKNRLSLRLPQSESLNILAQLCSCLALKKGADLVAELKKVKDSYATCSDFERNFPSICFALATGVGKTRLMGAFISYLYIEKGLKNFFVLAPNLTIYNKLIEDFGNPSHPKYVFKGIGEFASTPPRIINGDNYQHARQGALFTSEVHINVFNISKINAEARGGKEPRIKRLSEYLGDSYFNYLSQLNDLVLLMDESHHYRADRGMEVLNELNPVLGLEVTATPQVERGNQAVKFKNVVYEYSLAKAIKGGFVKEPAVATRKNFDPSRLGPDEVDRIKLEDGIRIHEDTKVQLDIYARDTKSNPVKPFLLIVAKDTDHASQLKTIISSSGFFNGYYADKVMEVHSNLSGSEKDENIGQLVSLENPDNKIEIVIHVNMLKEGWDVTNLYTIVPLRTAASTTLREQTIGRGLRLPYGKRTGVSAVDKLTIIAHDKFQEIIDAANHPDSIIRKENIIEIDPKDLPNKPTVITSSPNVLVSIQEEQKKAETISSPEEKQKALALAGMKQALIETLPELSGSLTKISDLNKDEIKEIVITKIEQRLSGPQRDLFESDLRKKLLSAYDPLVTEFTKSIIEIPRIVIQPGKDSKATFEDFVLDVKNLNYQPVSEEILVQYLQSQKQETVIGIGRILDETPERRIVSELMNHEEIDYDTHSDLLYKLAGQAVAKFRSYLDTEDKIMNVVQYNKRAISDFIYAQMMDHFKFDPGSFEKPKVLPFSRIEEHNYSKEASDKIHDLRDTIEPTNRIPSKVFTGFKKACHEFYKFESKTEKDLSIILEQDKTVLKWLRPAPNQFQIYWGRMHSKYRPDFVVETSDTIYMVETKAANEVDSDEVQAKTKSAVEYCNHATEHTVKNGGKPWKYVLIPHGSVKVNIDFSTLCREFGKK